MHFTSSWTSLHPHIKLLYEIDHFISCWTNPYPPDKLLSLREKLTLVTDIDDL
jgi:hypothetical protein